jgi:predicted 2-oxoglutarate/Fe(II)-dependent dioxygenase YbiX|tara:strand:- start:26 stop:568 length:543 start_codon:yes stop_codon:yes gene_type:complete
MNVDSYIKYYKNVVAENLCNSLINYNFPYEASKYQTHDSGAIVKQERVKMSDAWIKKESVFYTAVKSCFEEVIVKYKTDFPLFSVGRTTDFRINKYGKGGFMSRHVDNIHHSHGQQYGYPQVSALLYLNDDYDGGEFYVADKKFCPIKGSAIIFPSNFMFPHEAKPVTKGTRWSIVTWLM